MLAPELTHQPVEKSTRVRDRVITPIADEDRGHSHDLARLLALAHAWIARRNNELGLRRFKLTPQAGHLRVDAFALAHGIVGRALRWNVKTGAALRETIAIGGRWVPLRSSHPTRRPAGRDRFTLKIIARIMKLLTLQGYIIELGFHPCKRFPATTELRSGPGGTESAEFTKCRPVQSSPTLCTMRTTSSASADGALLSQSAQGTRTNGIYQL